MNAVVSTHYYSVSDKMYRKYSCQQWHLNYHICKNMVFCLLVSIWIVRPISLSDLNSSHQDVIPLITVFVVFVYVLVHYIQSTGSAPCHCVKAVHIVKQTSKEIVYNILLYDVNIAMICELKYVFKYQIRCKMSTWWFL